MITTAAALALTAAACSPAVAPAPAPVPAATSGGSTCGGPSSPPGGVIATVFQRTNSDRAANGLGALRWDAQLFCLASGWSAHLASTGTFTHQNLAAVLGTAPYGSLGSLGENIARGPGSMSGDQVQDAWMASAGHRANILSGAYSAVGIATAVAADGTLYATADFGG